MRFYYTARVHRWDYASFSVVADNEEEANKLIEEKQIDIDDTWDGKIISISNVTLQDVA